MRWASSDVDEKMRLMRYDTTANEAKSLCVPIFKDAEKDVKIREDDD